MRLKILVIVAFIAVSTHAQTEWWNQNFIIGTFSDPPAYDTLTAYSQYQRAIDAGFNLFTGVQQWHSNHPPYNSYNSIASTLCANDILFFISQGVDTSVNYIWASGQLIFDEPKQTDSSIIYDYVNYYNTNRSNQLPFVNLLPFYGFTNWNDYSSYIEYYCDYSNIPLPVLCFDNYRQDTYFNNPGDAGAYFSNLAELRRKAGNRPLWSCVNVTGDVPTWPVERQKAYMQLGAFAPMAYGCKGILYFMYDRLEPNVVFRAINYRENNDMGNAIYYNLPDTANWQHAFMGQFNTANSSSYRPNHKDVAIKTNENNGTWRFKLAPENGGTIDNSWNLQLPHEYGTEAYTRSFITNWTGGTADRQAFGVVVDDNRFLVSTDYRHWTVEGHVTDMTRDRLQLIRNENVCVGKYNAGSEMDLCLAYGDTIRFYWDYNTNTNTFNDSSDSNLHIIPNLQQLIACGDTLIALAWQDYGQQVIINWRIGSAWLSGSIALPEDSYFGEDARCWIERYTTGISDSLLVGYQDIYGHVYTRPFLANNIFLNNAAWQTWPRHSNSTYKSRAVRNIQGKYDLYCVLDTTKYRDGLLNANKDTTVRYSWAKEINTYLKHHITPIVMNWKWKGCWHSSLPEITNIDVNEIYVDTAHADSVIKSLSDNLMAGMFEREDSLCILIVNKSNNTISTPSLSISDNLAEGYYIESRSDKGCEVLTTQSVAGTNHIKLIWNYMRGAACTVIKMRKKTD